MHPAYIKGYTEVLTKLAVVTEEDISAALAGNKARDITSDEIEEYAQQRKQEALADTAHRPYLGAGIGAGIGGGIGALLTGIGHSRPLNAGIGALAGGGLGLGIGALSKGISGARAKSWGTTLGEIAQEGKVPRHMNMRSHEDLLPHARGIQEETAKPLTPEEFAAIRSGLMKELSTQGGIEGALSGASVPGDVVGAAVGAGHGTLEGMQEARERAGTLSDLYERGYGHLAGRMYEGQ